MDSSSKPSLLSENNRYPRFLAYTIFVYAVLLFAHDMTRFWGFGYSLDDIGIYNQVIWNTTHGHWLQTSIKFPFHEDSSWLGFHFVILPILLAAVIYAVFPGFTTLLVIHVCVVSLTAAVVYKTCRKLDLTPRTSFFWSAIYLLHPVTIFHGMFSFEETAFSVLLTALGYYYIFSRNFKWLVIVSVLLIFTKEHHGLTVFGLGMVWAWYNKSWRQGILLSLFGLACLALVLFVIMPYFSPFHEHFMLSNQAEDNSYNRYQWLKLPFDQMLQSAPKIIFFGKNIAITLGLLALICFLPLWCLVMLLPVAPDYLAIILSNSIIPKSINLYYSAPFIVPFILSAAYVLKNSQIKHPRLTRMLKINVLAMTLLGATQPLNIVYSKVEFTLNNKMDWMINKDYQELIAKIPSDKMLMTDQQGYDLSARRKIMLFNGKYLNDADYVLLRISPFDFSPAVKMQNGYSLVDSSILIKSPDWQLIHWKYPYALFAKNAKPQPDVNRQDFMDVMWSTARLFDMFGTTKQFESK